MNIAKKIFGTGAFAFLVFGGMSCCKDNPADFSQVGRLGKLATPTSKGGTHFIGDTSIVGTTYAAYTTYVSYDSNINLDQYVGDTISIIGKFVGQSEQGNVPDLLEVLTVKKF